MAKQFLATYKINNVTYTAHKGTKSFELHYAKGVGVFVEHFKTKKELLQHINDLKDGKKA